MASKAPSCATNVCDLFFFFFFLNSNKSSIRRIAVCFSLTDATNEPGTDRLFHTLAQAGNKIGFLKLFSPVRPACRTLGAKRMKSCLEFGGAFCSHRARGGSCGALRTRSRGSLTDGRYREETWQPSITNAAARRYISARCALGRTRCSVRGCSERMWRSLRSRAPVMDGARVAPRRRATSLIWVFICLHPISELQTRADCPHNFHPVRTWRVARTPSRSPNGYVKLLPGC